jgi:hypothetical protein
MRLSRSVEKIPAFGEYAGSPLSVCMEKRISP